jgi:hypothetical protein
MISGILSAATKLGKNTGSRFGSNLAAKATKHGGGVRGWSRAIGGTAVTGGFIGLGFYSESLTTGEEYGQGAGIIKGALYMVPWVNAALTIYNLGQAAGDMLYNNQQARRRTSFGRGFQDPFGNAATMRQRSQYNLNRGRASLGSEAALYHS